MIPIAASFQPSALKIKSGGRAASAGRRDAFAKTLSHAEAASSPGVIRGGTLP